MPTQHNQIRRIFDVEITFLDKLLICKQKLNKHQITLHKFAFHFRYGRWSEKIVLGRELNHIKHHATQNLT